MDETVSPGVVIRVKDWPGTFGERYVVAAIRDVPGSEYPEQVDAHRLDSMNGAPALAALRTFPLDCCVVDARKTRDRARHLARVEQRMGGAA